MTLLSFVLVAGCAGSQDELPIVQEVVVGWDFACALLVNGRISCWGQGVQKFGIKPPPDRFVDIEGDASFVCGIADDRSVQCWGNNAIVASTPDVGEYVAISASEYGACALDSSGTAICWPDSYVALVGEAAFDWIAATSEGLCGLIDGRAECVCRESDCLTAGAPPGSFNAIAGGSTHACALDDRGNATCWGGWLYTSEPPTGKQFLKLSAGEEYTCGLSPDGDVQCWAYFGDSYADLIPGEDESESAVEIMRDIPSGNGYLGIAANFGTAAAWTAYGVSTFGEPIDGSLDSSLAYE